MRLRLGFFGRCGRWGCGSKIFICTTAVGLAACAYAWLVNNVDYFKAYEWAGKVKKLTVYPLSSGQGIDCVTAICSKSGLVTFGLRNKQYCVARIVTETPHHSPEMNRKKSQSRARRSTIAPMGTIKQIQTSKIKHIRAIIDKQDLVLTAPATQSIRLNATKILQQMKSNNEQPKQVRCGANVLSGYDMGDRAAKWLSSFLELSNLRLIYLVKAMVETTKGRNQYGNVVLSSDASIELINKRLRPNPAIDATYFRANIVLRESEGLIEKTWDELTIGGRVVLQVTGSDLRMVSTKPGREHGEYLKELPLKHHPGTRVLSGLCRTECVGVNALVLKEGEISVGEPVYNHKRTRLFPPLGF